MKRIHSTLIALVIAGATTAGLYAAVKTVQLGQKAAAPSVSAREVASRQAKLADWRRSLDAARAKRPPALPKIPHFAPLPARAVAPPSLATAQPQVPYVQPAPVVKYVHAPATTTPSTHSGDDSGDDGGGDDSGGDDG